MLVYISVEHENKLLEPIGNHDIPSPLKEIASEI